MSRKSSNERAPRSNQADRGEQEPRVKPTLTQANPRGPTPKPEIKPRRRAPKPEITARPRTTTPTRARAR